MAFRNSILAGEELVRSGIRSANYAAGVAGWRVDRDGNADFNDVVMRGAFTTGQNPDPFIDIDDSLGPRIRFHSGDGAIPEPGVIFSTVSDPGDGELHGTLYLEPPSPSATPNPHLNLWSEGHAGGLSILEVVADLITGIFPVGSMTAMAAAAIPNGWLICGGQAVSRTTYAALWNAIGITYGPGDGVTTFNVPDLRGRIPVGLDNMGGTDAGRLNVPNVLGGAGGAQTVTLTAAEMPSHTHVQNVHNHNFAYNNSPSAFGANFIAGSSAAGALGNAPTVVGNATATNQNTGGGGAHNNLQPYLLTNWMIRAL